jgi:hemerythrin-like domain-containing protein
MEIHQRRRFLQNLGLAGLSFSVIHPALGAEKEAGPNEEEISPEEDLMREHGVLKRVLLIYRECLHRLQGNQDLKPELLADSANIIRSFIEDYHEKLEEDFLFPRFKKANKLVDLVNTLKAQHDGGRRLTDQTLQLATAAAMKDNGQRQKLARSLELFIRMYEPHEAREDTVLFPAFRRIVTPHEHDALGEHFEDQEHKQFGQDGFQMMVAKVANIEKQIGIYDLNQFTPPQVLETG